MPCLKTIRIHQVLLYCLGTWLLTSIGLARTTLTSVISAEDNYVAYLSISDVTEGEEFLRTVGNWRTPETVNVELTDGVTNYLHIVANDFFGAIPALIGTFTLSDTNFVFPNGAQGLSTDAVYWQMGEVAFGSSHNVIEDRGPIGTAPWGALDATNLAAEARFISPKYAGPSGLYFFSVPIISSTSAAEFSIRLLPNSSSEEVIEEATKPIVGFVDKAEMKTLATSNPGRVGVLADFQINQDEEQYDVDCISEFVAYDFIATSSGGETTVDLSLNLLLKGRFKGGAGIGGKEFENSSLDTSIRVTAIVNHEDLGRGELFDGSATILARHVVGFPNPGTELTPMASGMLDGVLPADVSFDGQLVSEFDASIDTMITTPVFQVDVGVPFSLILDLSTRATGARQLGMVVSLADFTGGLSFPTAGDVFNLPEGFSINSASSNIKNNRFEAGGDPPEPEKVFVEGLFLQLPEIEGESEAIDREGWIDLTSASSNVSNPSSGLSHLAPLHGGVVVSKYLDLASPLLAAEVNNPTPKDMVIEVNSLISQDWYRSFQYRLKDVLVRDYQIMAPGIGEPVWERLTLEYSYVDWVYEFFGSTGPSKGGVSTWWDLATNSGGATSLSPGNQPPSAGPVGNQLVDPGSEGLVIINLSDQETAVDQITASVSTTRPDLIGELQITWTGAERQVSFIATALRSGLAPISVEISDGTDIRTLAIPVLIDVEMTPFEGFLAAHFPEEELYNPTYRPYWTRTLTACLLWSSFFSARIRPKPTCLLRPCRSPRPRGQVGGPCSSNLRNGWTNLTFRASSGAVLI